MTKPVKPGSGNTYDLLCEMVSTNGIFKKAIQSGIVSYTWMEHKEVYEKYLCYRKAGNGKMTAYEFTASDCFISSETVRKIVSRMQS